MHRIRHRNRAQLVLALEKQNPEPLAEHDIEGLVEALADLLLQALEAAAVPETGGVDEHQNYA